MKGEIVATQWRKSSYSAHEGGECIEVATSASGVAVRDSKNPARHAHRFSRTAFADLLEGIRERY
ncbi:hypothetical protein GCM10022221_06170 [Actinocorallia aurea]